MNDKIVWMSKKRSCGECAKCCEGWLRGEAHGHDFYSGKPCFFLQKTCTIYDNRPDDPCKTYECEWILDNSFPEWLKPSLSNVIITKRKKHEIEYYEVLEAGKKIDSSVLSWLIVFALNKRKNLFYQVDGGYNKIGCSEFLNMIL